MATGAPADLAGSIPSSWSRTKRWAAANAMLVASEVLPMPGRPARISKIALVKPADLALIPSRPVVTPLTDARRC